MKQITSTKLQIPNKFEMPNLKLQTVLIILAVIVFLMLVGWLSWRTFFQKPAGYISPMGSREQASQVKEKPLDKYTFENLKKRGGKASAIKLEELRKETENCQVYTFSYQSDGRKITGLAHIPVSESSKIMPVIIQSRGYVDREEYESGIGTQPSAQVYASNGFISLAPDFLGYGKSQMPPDNVWEERFLRLMAVMDLIASVKSLPQADPEKIFLWGHSNGGMITLSVLEITGGAYPTVLWAPVSRFFPYDVLFYTNEAEDKGKFLRKLLSDFEVDYDVDKYSIDEYFDWIKAPLQVQQGSGDPFVPIIWTNELVEKLKALDLGVDYYTYPGADHNLAPDWDTVVQRDLEFYKSFL